MEKEKFTLSRRIKSFSHAFHGIGDLILREHNSRIHLVAAAVVIGAGFWLRVSAQQWVDLVLAMGLVLAAEAFNTCVEKTADLVSVEKNEQIRFIKDVSAGAVLITAIAAAVVGLIVFLPLLEHLKA